MIFFCADTTQKKQESKRLSKNCVLIAEQMNQDLVPITPVEGQLSKCLILLRPGYKAEYVNCAKCEYECVC